MSVPDAHGSAEYSESAVLHALRVGGVLGLEDLWARSGLARPELDRVLIGLERETLVQRNSGGLKGWSLTPAGRARGEQLLAEELDSRGARPLVVVAYRRFRVANGELLSICTDWQVRSLAEPMELNDHSDPGYDAAVLVRLEQLHIRASRILVDLEAALDRFGSYRQRLNNALDRVGRGGVDWVTRPLIDSYHTVWFELHEDLLATLGRQRSDEVAEDGDHDERTH